MTYKTLLFEINEGIGTIVINRPESLNALNLEAYNEIFQLFSKIENDPEVKAVIITGSGNKAFVAGTDIASMVSMSASEAAKFSANIRTTCDFVSDFPKPVIAAINGFALGGGCELALCADFRVAAENAKFGQPEIDLGIIPGSGGTQRLARLVGISRAKELIYFGNMIDANTALNWGLVNKVVAAENLMSEAIDMAKKVLNKSSVTLALAKKAVNEGNNIDLKEGLDIESKYFAQCFNTLDQKEGIKAFLEKRKPYFNNK